MTKEQIIQHALNQWFKHDLEITTLDFKNQLRKDYPLEHWTQQYVSKFLYQQGLDFGNRTNAHGDTYRVYSAPKILNSTVLLDQIDVLDSVGEPITKTKLKTLVRNMGYPLANFQQVFDSLGLTHTGQWTNDNHKIWAQVKLGQHFSKTKHQAIDIRTMPKPYLANALKKSKATVSEILANPSSSEHEMLKAYFMYDVRKLVD